MKNATDEQLKEVTLRLYDYVLRWEFLDEDIKHSIPLTIILADIKGDDRTFVSKILPTMINRSGKLYIKDAIQLSNY